MDIRGVRIMLLVVLPCLLAVSYTRASGQCSRYSFYCTHKKFCANRPKPFYSCKEHKIREAAAKAKAKADKKARIAKEKAAVKAAKAKEEADYEKAVIDTANLYLLGQRKTIYSVAHRNALIELGAPKTASVVDVNAWYDKETNITIQLHQLAVQLHLPEVIKATTFDHYLIPYGVVIEPLPPKPGSQAQSPQGHFSSKSQPRTPQAADDKWQQSHSSSKSQTGTMQRATGYGGINTGTVYSSSSSSINSRESFPSNMEDWYDGQEEALQDYQNGFHENALDDWDDADLWDTSNFDPDIEDPISGARVPAHRISKESARQHAFRRNDNSDSDSDSSDPAEQASNPATNGNSDAAGPENEPPPGRLSNENSDAAGPENEPPPGHLPNENSDNFDEPAPGYGGNVNPNLEQFENEEEAELRDFQPISRQQATNEADEEDGVNADEEQIRKDDEQISEDEAEDAGEEGDDAAEGGEDAAEDTSDIGEAGEIAEDIGFLGGL